MKRRNGAKFECGEVAKPVRISPRRLAAALGVSCALLVATFANFGSLAGRALAHSGQVQMARQPDPPLRDARLALLKAGAVRHLPGHTEWPQERFDDQGDRLAPIIILVVGVEGFGFERYLEEVTVGQRAHNRELIVRRAHYPRPQLGQDEPTEEDLERFRDQLRQAHVLYIGDSERSRGRFRRILEWVDGHAILTVSALDDFAERGGGMIGLGVRENRLAMDASVDLIRRADLKVSSRLLRLARIIRLPKGDRQEGNGD